MSKNLNGRVTRLEEKVIGKPEVKIKVTIKGWVGPPFEEDKTKRFGKVYKVPPPDWDGYPDKWEGA